MLLRGNLLVESLILPDGKSQPATFFPFREGKIGSKIGRFYPASAPYELGRDEL
jgi:hypothetical protein